MNPLDRIHQLTEENAALRAFTLFCSLAYLLVP